MNSRFRAQISRQQRSKETSQLADSIYEFKIRLSNSSVSFSGPGIRRIRAALAGVSAGTVCSVIRGPTRVSEDARSKVLDAIRVLKYQPNLIARSLRTNRTHTLGIVVPDLTIPFFPKIVRGDKPPGNADIS